MNRLLKLRHALVSYVVALLFGINGVLSSAIDANMASGTPSFAPVTCLGGQIPGEFPGQPNPTDRAGKCACSLSSCCCANSLARNADATDADISAADPAPSQRRPHAIAHGFRASHPLHLRSPPAA
jgi:hypothetical protein